MSKFVSDRPDNDAGKGENAEYQLFLHFPLWVLKVPIRPSRKVFVYKIQVNPIHTSLKYGSYYDFMDW